MLYICQSSVFRLFLSKLTFVSPPYIYTIRLFDYQYLSKVHISQDFFLISVNFPVKIATLIYSRHHKLTISKISTRVVISWIHFNDNLSHSRRITIPTYYTPKWKALIFFKLRFLSQARNNVLAHYAVCSLQLYKKCDNLLFHSCKISKYNALAFLKQKALCELCASAWISGLHQHKRC